MNMHTKLAEKSKIKEVYLINDFENVVISRLPRPDAN